MALFIKGVLIFAIYMLPTNLLDYSGQSAEKLTDFAPELWLSLLGFVFGTLIIVVSIASEKTPKLIDLFVTEYWSCLFIWLIALCSLENIFLHFQHSGHRMFFDNMVFLNNYVFLPTIIIAAIPYIFYILKYTKSSSVIKRIFNDNLRTIRSARKVRSEIQINENHFRLLESVNQLHDLLQYIELKEPQADIIHKLGRSLRHYLEQKHSFPESYFKISSAVKNDVSFSTLSDKYLQIQNKKTFYEQKILRVLGTSYLLLIKDSHYDLASLCGSELFETGKTAVHLKDHNVTETVIIYFNTMLRFGINNGIKAREIRNTYNTIFHYSQLVDLLIEKRQNEKIIQCCGYFRFYANEVRKVSSSEPIFFFLVEAFAVELKKVLIAIHNNNFPREMQAAILTMFNELSSHGTRRSFDTLRDNDSGLRLIQIALSLFYMKNDEVEFNDVIVDSMVRDMKGLDRNEVKQTTTELCNRLQEASEDFWEETDQGSENIYYSPDKGELPKFLSYISSKIESIKEKNLVSHTL
jgi:hypothetical protein